MEIHDVGAWQWFGSDRSHLDSIMILATTTILVVFTIVTPLDSTLRTCGHEAYVQGASAAHEWAVFFVVTFAACWRIAVIIHFLLYCLLYNVSLKVEKAYILFSSHSLICITQPFIDSSSDSTTECRLTNSGKNRRFPNLPE